MAHLIINTKKIMGTKIISISKTISLPKLQNGIQLIGYHCFKVFELDMLSLQLNITKVLHFGNQTLNLSMARMFLSVEILLVSWPKV